MEQSLRRHIQRELRLVERFGAAYHNKFHDMIERLNASQNQAGHITDGQSLRLCVETVDMMLTIQRRLAQVLATLSSEGVAFSAAA